MGIPLKGHQYHAKSDAELRYIIADAGEAAQCMRGVDHDAECKYLDQVNDACTVLHYRAEAIRNPSRALVEAAHPNPLRLGPSHLSPTELERERIAYGPN